MPEFASARSSERARGVSYDAGNGAREREQAAKETPEQAAAKRVELLWHDADSAKERGAKLSGIVVRQEWREERTALKAKHQGLEKELAARAVDAEVSEHARERYKDAAGKAQALGEELEQAKEPRAKPPVRDEVELEPSILSRKMPPDQLLAWVASLDKRERKAVEDRVVAMGGSADREDGFAVALSNYFGNLGVRKAYETWAKATGLKVGPSQPTLRDRFLAVARDPRHWVTLGPAPVPGAKTAGRSTGEAAPAAVSSPSSAHPGGQGGKQPAKAGDVQGGGGLEWAGAGKAGRVYRNATADTFVDSATRETVELETSWTMAEFDQFELKTNMVMEVERKIHIQLAHGGVVIKSRARAFFNADQPPNDVHAALQAPARLVKHDGAIFATDEKAMHLMRTLELLLPETPSVAGLLAHEPMLGFDIDPKQRIQEADQFVTVTVPTYERNMELVDGIMRDAPHAAMGLKNYIKVKLSYENPPTGALAIGRHMIGRIEELVQFSWTGYEGTDLRVQLGLMWEGFQKLVQQAEAAKPAEKQLLDHASDLVVAIGKAGVGVVLALKEVGLMARDVGLWGLDKLSNAFGYEIDWSASSSIGKAYESGKSTSEIFKAIVDGIIDSWSKAVDHAENGDYSQLMDLGAELALDIAIEVVTAGAATPGVAAKRAGTAARLAEHALVLTEDAVEALTRRTEAMLQRAKQALRRVPEDVRAAMLDTIDVASGVLDSLKGSVKVADAGVGTMRLVDKTAITQAIQRSRGARAIEAAKGAMTKLRGPAARAQGASVVDQLEKLAAASKMPDTIYAVARRIAEGSDKAKLVAALDKLLKGTARALDEDVVAGVLRRAADAVAPLAFLDNVEWVMARKGISIEACKALVRQAVLRDSPLDLRWLRELTELPDDMLEMMALDPATNWRSFMKVSKKPSDYFPSSVNKTFKNTDYADASAKLRGVAGEMVFVLEDAELPGKLKIVARQVDAAGKVIDFGLVDAHGARALLEVKAWRAGTWARELAAAEAGSPQKMLSNMVAQLRAATEQGHPVYLAVSDAIGSHMDPLRRFLARQGLHSVTVVEFPESKLSAVSSTLRKSLALSAGALTVTADQMTKAEDE